MKGNPPTAGRRFTAGMVLLLAAFLCLSGAYGQDAATLRARHMALGEQLASSPFQRPLVLHSTQTDGTLKGDVYALMAHPFRVVGPALEAMEHWCDILILHLNVKYCRGRSSPAGSVLGVAVGRRFDQPLSDAYRVDFAYRVVARRPDYLQVLLDAESGPLGTRDYRIVFEAIPFDATSSFVHMSYSYGYGLTARVAMQTYLATIGRDKVGFSVVARNDDGTAVYVDNVRGVVERNTMRYFLAIEAYLGAYSMPLAAQPEKRLRDWFAATERYPRQLHELEREQYLAMKRRELARQRAAPVTAH